jgi:histidyl-tRNA synthetase
VSFEAPKGTHDVLPSEAALWQRVLAEAEAICRAYGYERITVPTFEDTDLFARTAGEVSDVVNKEMYSFTDRGDRSLTLRPEATAGICRAYVEHGLHREPQPVKVWTAGPMFRYAQPQKGRYREFWQLDLEAIGSDDPALDAELLHLQATLFERLGIEAELHLNSIGDRTCRPAYVAELEAWLDAHASDLDEDARHKRATSPLRVFDTKNPHVAALLEEAPAITDALCPACAEHYASVKRTLQGLGVAYTEDRRLVRGLDYYTRTAWEFVGGGLGAQDTISGGGRYDYLIEEIGGPPTPAVGFASGIERIVLSVQEQGAAAEREPIDVFVATDDGADRTQVLAAIGRLRARGLAVETDYAGRSLKGQLKQAHRLAARATVIATAGAATIRRHGEPDVETTYEELEERIG